jgi:phospholipase C
MRHLKTTALGAALAIAALGSNGAMAGQLPPGMQNLNHIIIVMQENHSFDNYFGVLPYAPSSPYHAAAAKKKCGKDDHQCVDGLTCVHAEAGGLACFNSNVDDDTTRVAAFHDANRCVAPDLDHGWVATHQEVNLNNPNQTLMKAPNDGYVAVNDANEQHDNGGESPNGDETMGYYDQTDLPFYYDLAQKFAISDRMFSSVLGPTFPNRAYLMSATSFGHLTTNDTFPPPGGYKPLTGTILDLMEAQGVTWADYFQDAPQGGSFRNFVPPSGPFDPHFFPRALLLAQLSGAPGVPPLPQVVFVDPNFGLTGASTENDEHPPTDIQRGQANVAQVVNALRNGPYWHDSILFITYDEHGGFYDHVKPPKAPQGGQATPDGISPGQCADASNLPASGQPGGGAECNTNLINPAGNSVATAEALCPDLTADPTGPFPPQCATFNQLGVRIPFMAVSPFSKPSYVSHAVADHTSMLALIEKRFMTKKGQPVPHLTARDKHADTLEDMFDFVNSPSLGTAVGTASPPSPDCTPTSAAAATAP